MNQITKIFNELTDSQLKEAILEMKEDDTFGIIRENGYVRNITKQIVDITNQPLSAQLFITTISLYKEAAYRFTNS